MRRKRRGGPPWLSRKRALVINTDALLFVQNLFIGVSPYLLSTGLSCAVPVFSHVYGDEGLVATYAIIEWAALLAAFVLSPLLFIRGRYESQVYMYLLHAFTAANGLLSGVEALFWNVSTNGIMLYVGGYIASLVASFSFVLFYGTLALNNVQCVALSVGLGLTDIYGDVLTLVQEQSQSSSIVGLTYVFVLPVVFQACAIIFTHFARFTVLRSRGAALFLDSLGDVDDPTFTRPAIDYSPASLVPQWYGPLAIFVSCGLSTLLVTRFAFDFTQNRLVALLEILLFHSADVCGRLLALCLRRRILSLYHLVLFEFMIFSVELLLCTYEQATPVSISLVLSHGIIHGLTFSYSFFSRPQLPAKLLRRKYDGKLLDAELHSMESLRAQNKTNWSSDLQFGVLAEYKADVNRVTAAYKKLVAMCSLLGTAAGVVATWCVGQYLDGARAPLLGVLRP